jgi:hypothetical protein
MMPRRENDPFRRLPMDCPEELGVETGLVGMMSRDNAKMREAGCSLAEAAGRVVRDYDGLHRLSIAISAWYSAIAGEGDRDTRHDAPSEASTHD